MNDQEKKNENTTTFVFNDDGAGGRFEPNSVTVNPNDGFSVTYYPPVESGEPATPGKTITVTLKPPEDFVSSIKETHLSEKLATIRGFGAGQYELGENSIHFVPDTPVKNEWIVENMVPSASFNPKEYRWSPGDLFPMGFRPDAVQPDFRFMQTSDEPEVVDTLDAYNEGGGESFITSSSIVGFPMQVGGIPNHDWMDGKGGLRRPDYSQYLPSPASPKVVSITTGFQYDWSVDLSHPGEKIIGGGVIEHVQKVLDGIQETSDNPPYLIVDLPIKRQPQLSMCDTVVPIPQELLQEESNYFIVNYSQSVLKGVDFLHYLTNLKHGADITFDLPLRYEEYSELMLAYTYLRHVVEAPSLHALAAQLLLDCKGQNFLTSPYATAVVNPSFFTRFFDEHKELVSNWIHFIDSTQVLALSLITPLKKHYEPKKVFENIDDEYYVGCNIAKLFAVPDFILYYFGLQGAEYKLSYFTQQFEQPMFNDKSISTYFRSRNNYAAKWFENLAEGYFKPSDIGIGIFSIGVFSPEMNLVEYDAVPKK